MEKRKAKMLFGKNGQGNRTTRITIPVTWARKAKFSEDNRNAEITLNDEGKIIIEKEE